jgi:hypothetical protein
MSATIEANHGLPQVQVLMMREAGRVVIDIPDSVDDQKLAQNLQQELSQAVQMKDQWPADANEAYRAITHHVLIALTDTRAQTGANGASGASGGSTAAGAAGAGAAGSGASGGGATGGATGSTGTGTAGGSSSGGSSSGAGAGASDTGANPQ